MEHDHDRLEGQRALTHARIPLDASDDIQTTTRKIALNSADQVQALAAEGVDSVDIANRIGVSPFWFGLFLKSPEGQALFDSIEQHSRFDNTIRKARVGRKLTDLALQRAEAEVVEGSASSKSLAETQRVLLETADPGAFKQPAAAAAPTQVNVSLYQALQVAEQRRKALTLIPE
jgi:hypothetical protein